MKKNCFDLHFFLLLSVFRVISLLKLPIIYFRDFVSSFFSILSLLFTKHKIPGFERKKNCKKEKRFIHKHKAEQEGRKGISPLSINFQFLDYIWRCAPVTKSTLNQYSVRRSLIDIHARHLTFSRCIVSNAKVFLEPMFFLFFLFMLAQISFPLLSVCCCSFFFAPCRPIETKIWLNSPQSDLWTLRLSYYLRYIVPVVVLFFSLDSKDWNEFFNQISKLHSNKMKIKTKRNTGQRKLELISNIYLFILLRPIQYATILCTLFSSDFEKGLVNNASHAKQSIKFSMWNKRTRT